MKQLKLHKSLQQEEFSIAYVHAIAATAGFGVEYTRVDIDSVDLVIKQYGDSQLESYPFYDVLNVQLKCTSQQQFFKNDHIAYPLKIKNYNDLRRQTANPYILIVVHVPEDSQDWLRHSEKELVLRYCAYWVSLKDKPAVPATGSKDQTITVHIPLKNQLTVTELQRIIILLAKGEKP